MPPQPASHVFFFSYASENRSSNGQLVGFFEDLCAAVAVHTKWAERDQRVSFRDGVNLPLMETWEPALMKALQTSAVLVCVTSLAYFQSRFCGQEYSVFDRRRRQNLKDKAPVPAVILPVIWAPTPGGLPEYMNEMQWGKDEMPAQYDTKGLHYLRIADRTAYDKCVLAFAEAIKTAWLKNQYVVELPNLETFDDIPNKFADGAWDEAKDPDGNWLSGPGVANFVYAASSNVQLPEPPGRYGAKSSDWRPYSPESIDTIEKLTRGVAKNRSLAYREIPVDDNLEKELEGARRRKNLTLVVADAKTLPLNPYSVVATFDNDPWEGTAVLMPWDGKEAWNNAEEDVKKIFPIRSQAKSPPFLAPIKEYKEYEPALDNTLTDLRTAVTRVEAEKKPRSDQPPSQVQGPSGASS